jgi:DNA-binding NarL/FixJ family response regulator
MRQITVLVIDEHAEVSARLGRALAGMAGFRVLAHTTNPIWAAELAKHWKPQVIIADFQRGAARRAEMVRWLKEMSPESRVVVYSTYFVEGERAEFLEAGASRCLLKGLALDELAGELRDVTIGDEKSVAAAASVGRA